MYFPSWIIPDFELNITCCALLNKIMCYSMQNYFNRLLLGI